MTYFDPDFEPFWKWLTDLSQTYQNRVKIDQNGAKMGSKMAKIGAMGPEWVTGQKRVKIAK